MLISIVCFGCGKNVAQLFPLFKAELQKGATPAEALLQFQTKWSTCQKHVNQVLRFCCSRTILATEEKGIYLQLIERIAKLKP